MSMPMSIEMQAAFERAKGYDLTLVASDFTPSQFVSIEMDDGSQFTWESAFIRMWGLFTVVFTEHYSFHVFATNDIESAYEWKITRHRGELLDMEENRNARVGE
jgi:hypothetical protein